MTIGERVCDVHSRERLVKRDQPPLSASRFVAFTPGELVGPGGPTNASVNVRCSMGTAPCAPLTAATCESLITGQVC